MRLHSAIQTSAAALSYRGVGVVGRRCWRLGWGLGTWELGRAEGVSFYGFHLVKPLLVTQPGSAHIRQPGRAVGEDHGLHIRLLSQRGHRLLRHSKSPSRRPSSPASGAGLALDPPAGLPLAPFPSRDPVAMGQPCSLASLPSRSALGGVSISPIPGPCGHLSTPAHTSHGLGVSSFFPFCCCLFIISLSKS